MVWNEKGKGWGARASWFDESGKRHRKSKTWFRTKREAVEWEQQYLSDHADRAPDADNMTVRQLLEAYITSCKLRGRDCLLYTSPRPLVRRLSRMPSSA
mgnify:CR=1 FL=1